MIDITFEITSEGRRFLDTHDRRDRLLAGLAEGLAQGLTETANHIKSNYARGGSPRTPRRGQAPLAVRSGALLQSIGSESSGLEGRVGVFAGPASRYARAVAGEGTTVIRPVRAKHLWQPIADNLTASGQVRMSPREAMSLVDDQGRRRLRIFTSKRGNTVAFLPDPAGGKYTRGANKGRERGKLLFVLRDEIEVEGSRIVARGVTDLSLRIESLLQGKVDEVFR